MNLVKWLRKNNTKIMAVVVIVLMVGFVGGSALPHFFRSDRGMGKPVAYFGQNGKITGYDLAAADSELNLLRMLQADQLLRWQNMQGLLLGELLFSEQGTSPELVRTIKQSIRTNQYRISDEQINDMYRRRVPARIYWLLLRNEAEMAGVRVANEGAGELLGRAIPRLFDGRTYSQVIGSIVNQRGIPQDQILATLGRLLAVLQYAGMVCSNENVTGRQIMNTASLEQEAIDIEFVRIDAEAFADKQAEPDDEKLAEHLEKYGEFFAGAVSEQNPYGFGYKLPDRVQLEYLAVKLDDVRATVTPPTREQMVEFYNRQKEQLFTEQVLSDPNDPNSELIRQIRGYDEVADVISEQLIRSKTDSTANTILLDAKALTGAEMEEMDAEAASLTVEQLKAMAGDYETAAEQISKKHDVKVYTGRTGLLSARDMQSDEHLGALYMQGYGRNPVALTQVVYAVDELAASELGPFDLPKPRMYENIGPVRDILGQIMVIVRVVEAEKASEPEGIDQAYSISTLKLDADPNEQEPSEDVYSVREKVAEDLKRLAAMDTAKGKAQEFTELAAKDGWDGAIDKFNELYAQQQEKSPGEPNEFRLQNLSGLRRISRATLETFAVLSEGNPSAPFFLNERDKQRQFVNQLYSLVPQDSNSVESLPVVMEFKPDLSYYVIKDIAVKRLWKEDYETSKAMRLYREELVQSQSLAAIHFNPENILKRMKFRPALADKKTQDANAPAESETAS